MKLIFSVLLASASLLPALAQAGEASPLDGKSYCRTIVSNGDFGQPKGSRKHCLSFSNGYAKDTANTFFGNPPEMMPYELNERILTFGKSKFVVARNLEDLVAISGSTSEGTVFDLER